VLISIRSTFSITENRRVNWYRNEPSGEPLHERQRVEPALGSIHRSSIFTCHHQKHTRAHQWMVGAHTRTGITEKVHHGRTTEGGLRGTDE
jgi:hypothetical protein